MKDDEEVWWEPLSDVQARDVCREIYRRCERERSADLQIVRYYRGSSNPFLTKLTMEQVRERYLRQDVELTKEALDDYVLAV